MKSKRTSKLLLAVCALLCVAAVASALSLCAFALCENDAIPENRGIAYEDPTTGLLVSYASKIPVPVYGPTGGHGGHEQKVLRTENYGTYAVYISSNEELPEDDPEYGNYTYDCFTVLKIDGEQETIIYEGKYDQAAGSSPPNILGGEDGKMYVVVAADDKAKYFGSRTPADNEWGYYYANEGAILQTITFDLTADPITYTVSSAYPDFKLQRVHGYGYTQPIMDEVNKKIYLVFDGGEVPGYLNWFIYDIETGTWDETCHLVETTHRLGYFNGYADGKGGFYMVAQRMPPIDQLAESLGVKMSVTSGYLWDALYLVEVPDVTKEEYNIQPIHEPNYIPYNDVTQPVNRGAGATHYDRGGTLLDHNGNLHVLYTTDEGLNTASVVTTIHYDVFDPSHTRIIHNQLTFDDPANDYHLDLAEDADGDIYIFAVDGAIGVNTATMEIWRSKDGGYSFVKAATLPVVTADGKQLEPGKFLVSSPRNKSVVDDYVGMIMLQDNSQGEYYYYLSIRMKTPCDHQLGEGTTVAPTCGGGGYTKYTCSVCGFELHDDIVPSLGGHKWGPWTTTKAATASRTGTEKHTCTVCNQSETRTIPKLGTSAGEILAAGITNLEDGYICSSHNALHAKFIDNASMNIRNVRALFASAFGIPDGSPDFTIDVDETAVNALIEAFAALANGGTASQDIRVTIVLNEDGSSVLDKTYTLCAEKATRNASIAFQICPDELELIKGQQAAAFAAFEKQYVCAAHGQAHISYYSSSLLNTTLGTILQKAFDAEKYTVSVNKSDVTAMASAYKSLVSGNSITGSVRVTLAHPLFTTCSTTYTLGVCITKDTVAKLNSLIDCPDKPVGIPGDVNGDGELTNADAIYLLRSVMLGETDYPLFYDGDVNSDGSVNNTDAIYLLRYIMLGGDSYPIYA